MHSFLILLHIVDTALKKGGSILLKRGSYTVTAVSVQSTMLMNFQARRPILSRRS